jgi:hypothetical protein
MVLITKIAFVDTQVILEAMPAYQNAMKHKKLLKNYKRNISDLMVISFNVEKLYYSLSKINSIRL